VSVSDTVTTLVIIIIIFITLQGVSTCSLLAHAYTMTALTEPVQCYLMRVSAVVVSLSVHLSVTSEFY